MCNKDLNWTFLTLKKSLDLENNNGELESSLRNYLIQYSWATFDHRLIHV